MDGTIVTIAQAALSILLAIVVTLISVTDLMFESKQINSETFLSAKDI